MKNWNKIIVLIFLSIFIVSCENDIDKPESSIEITDFNPKSGAVGDEITITGTGFSSEKSDMNVEFAGAEAVIVSSTETELVVTVPEDAKTGKIKVKFGFMLKLTSEDFTFTGLDGSDANLFLPEEGTWIEFDRYKLDENLNQTQSAGKVVATVGGVVVKDGQNATEIVYKLADGEFGAEVNNKYVYATEDALYNYYSLSGYGGGGMGGGGNGGGGGNMGDEIPFVPEIGWIPVFKPNESSWEVFTDEMDFPVELADSLEEPLSSLVQYLIIKTVMNAQKDASGDQIFDINDESLTGEKVVMSLDVSLVVAEGTPSFEKGILETLLISLGIEQVMTQEITYWFSPGFGYLRNIEQFPEFNEAFISLLGGEGGGNGGGGDDVPFGMEEIIVNHGVNE